MNQTIGSRRSAIRTRLLWQPVGGPNSIQTKVNPAWLIQLISEICVPIHKAPENLRFTGASVLYYSIFAKSVAAVCKAAMPK